MQRLQPEQRVVVTAADIGTFPMTDEFLTASAEVLADIPALFYAHNMRRFPFDRSTMGYNSIDEEIEYFAEHGSPIGSIYASFLGTVALNARSLAEAQAIDVADLKAKVHHPDRLKEHTPAGPVHRDFRDAFATLNLRYVTSNHTATHIDGISDHAPGQIARLAHDKTYHQRPEIVATVRRPRVLLSVDV